MKRTAPSLFALRAGRVSPRVLLLTTTVLILALSPVSARQDTRQRLDPSLVRIDRGSSAGRTVFGTGEYLTGPSTADPAAIALDYVRQHAADFGLSNQEAAGVYVEKSHVAPTDGVGRVVLGQRVQGIRVHTAQLVATVDREGRLVMVSGRTAPARASGRATLHRYPNPYALGLREAEPVSAELVWFIAGDQLRLAWLTDVEVGSGAWFGTVIDAETGTTLERESRYKHNGPDGDVFTTQHPDVPGAVRQRVSFSGINGSWVTGTTTDGNNVLAYLDRDNSNANDEYQPSNASQHFRYAFTDAWRGLPDGTSLADLDAGTVTAAIDADIDAIITQLFYYTNDMHDWLWGHGFDERGPSTSLRRMNEQRCPSCE